MPPCDVGQAGQYLWHLFAPQPLSCAGRSCAAHLPTRYALDRGHPSTPVWRICRIRVDNVKADTSAVDSKICNCQYLGAHDGFRVGILPLGF
jgi:hypothetical protein